MTRKIYLNGILLAITLLWACSNMQNSSMLLTVDQFYDKLNEMNDAQVVDVRTPEEYAQGHLNKAQNININGSDFDSEIDKLDKNKPVFVYCLAGSRSASAAARMKAAGFKTIYDMSGGFMKWRSAGLPLSDDYIEDTGKGMSMAEFNKLTNTDKKVLVDFYAEWCVPCKKMKPYLDEISNEMAETVTVLRIDADANKKLLSEMKIDGLPVLMIFEKGQMQWRYDGFIEKSDVVARLK